MEITAAYIPIDRRHALARREELPERTAGAALIADLSGFTQLTHALVSQFGPQRGAEELTRQLDLVYDALIAEVDRYRGAVIGFSGDAITAWFDGRSPADTGDAPLRATTCGLAMQQAMKPFATAGRSGGRTAPLAVKVGVAAGPARRFVVGDPAIQLIDVVAGTTLDRVAAAEEHAKKGEVVLDATAAECLGERSRGVDPCPDARPRRRCAVVDGLSAPADPRPWPTLMDDALSDAQVRPWLLGPVYERLQAGQGEFLAELRPAAALFLRFGGIDYDDDAAAPRLDAYVRQVQGVLARYEGFLIQLTIGDKGSYLYAAFGAPLAHDDDARRVVAAGLELRALATGGGAVPGAQIGIGFGRMRTGSYGGRTRRTYGVLGEETNVAARLMQHAAPLEVLVSEAAKGATGGAFRWEDRPALQVKGRSEPLPASRLVGAQEGGALRLREARDGMPMVGRRAERERIEQRVAAARRGQGQIIAIHGEAGIGKSRLVAEIVGEDNAGCGLSCSGQCQSYGTNSSYLVWRSVWREFFGLDPDRSPDEQVRALQAKLAALDRGLLPRLPLLGVVLNLPIPDNDLTRPFDAKLRKASLEALLVDCLRLQARADPVLLILEDCHWLDPLSVDLLEVISGAISDLPVLLLLTYRSTEIDGVPWPAVANQPHFTDVRLGSLAAEEVEQLIGLKMEWAFGARSDLPPTLRERISTRAQGNPFYVEELLNYLHDLGLDPQDREGLEKLDLPSSLHSLVLSRIDQLTENQKATMKVASIVGLQFRAAWLWGAYPELGEPRDIRVDLDVLSHLHLTPLDTSEPELAYLFRHVTTQEVAYETLASDTRARLHERLGQYIERAYAESLDRFVDVLAYHYGRSDNEAKKRAYLRKAGDAAQAAYANSAAIYYYQRLLPLLDGAEKVEVLLRLGQVLELVGQWDEADALYREALDLVDGSSGQRPQCERAMGALKRRKGEYAEAAAWLDRARVGFERLGDRAGVAQVLHDAGLLAWLRGDYAAARALYEESLAIHRASGDRRGIVRMLGNLGILARYQGDYATARALYEESVGIARELGDKWAIAALLNNLALLARYEGDYAAARSQLEEAVALIREVGDRSYLATFLDNLGKVARDQGDYRAARALYEESLTTHRELRDRRELAEVIEDFAWLAALMSQSERAVRLAGAAATVRAEVGAPLAPVDQARLDDVLRAPRQQLGAGAEAIWEVGRAMTLEQAIADALDGHGVE